jgi:hypothetical protein
VERDERVAHDRELESRPKVRRHEVGDVARVRERSLGERPQPLVRDVLGRRVDRREVRRLGRLAEVVALDHEVLPAPLPTETNVRAGCELVDEPVLVEPDRVDRAGLVRDARGHERHAARPPPARAADDAADRSLLLAEEVGDPQLGRGGLVAEGRVPEQVAHAPQPQLREPPRDGDADSAQRVDGALEPLRPRRRTRGSPSVRRGETREAR